MSTVHSVCSPFTVDVDDLAYIAAATWPAFIRPVLDEHRRRVDAYRQARANHDEDEVPDSEPDEGVETEEVDIPLMPPTEDARMRLTRLFTPSISAALEALYPRSTNALAWARANVPPANLLSIPPNQIPPLVSKTVEDRDGERVLRQLPRMAKFILIAAYLASTNPHKTDMRIFGRGLDERMKRRRMGGVTRKMSAKASAVKVYALLPSSVEPSYA